MTHDDDKKLEQALQQAANVKPDAKAKAKALNAAMAAYDQAQAGATAAASEKNAATHQGSVQPLRPKANNNLKGRQIMKTLTNRWLYSGLAAASVLTLVVLVGRHQQFAPMETRLDEIGVTHSMEADGVAQVEIVEAEPAPAPRPEAKRSAEMSAPQPVAPPPQVAMKPQRQMSNDSAVSGLVAEESFAKRERALADMAMAPAPVMPSAPADIQPQAGYQDVGRDDFEHVVDNPVKRVAEEPVSTFSVDVDTASYSFVRRQLNQGVLPQKDAVRVEEMINYFNYAYPLPDSKSVPFSTNVVVSDSPWKAGNKLIQIGIKGYEMAASSKPKTNLVFLLDVSGSMNSADKLPLVKQSMELLLSQLGKDDSVAIAVYAGAAGTVLPPTPASDKQTILNALNQLQAGGSTAGGQGIKLAYELAAANFDKDAVNRVILATDGDFNVGITSRDELKGFVEREREKGIYLSVLGFGQGNYHDHLMQQLAQNGNGVAAYIDTLGEAQKVLVTEATSSLFPIAQDVKIQVEFNPATVAEYRLIGYETRALNREDFNNDAVDAGDIGAGHTVTALYEITPIGGDTLIDGSRYAQQEKSSGSKNEYAFVKLRYKLPGESKSKLIEQPVAARNSDTGNGWQQQESGFATAVAGFAQLLRGGKYTGDWNYDDALELAQANKGDDPYGYRTEFVQLIRKAKIAKGM